MFLKALDPPADSFYRPGLLARISAPLFVGAGPQRYSWAISSVVEHFVDIEGVTSSNLVSPTMNSLFRFSRGTPVTQGAGPRRDRQETTMKVRNSLRSLKNRHRDCRVVRRKGRVYVINKTQRRFKARQG